MAYLKEIWTKCSATSCASRAVVELFNLRNAKQGQFCRKHGNTALRVQKDLEGSELERERRVEGASVAPPRNKGLRPEGWL